MSAFPPALSRSRMKRHRRTRYSHRTIPGLAHQVQERHRDPGPAMASFGERMKREREMRGIKLEEIAESTKIGKRNLIALEEEQFDQLPGGIFNKGFVRAYAKYLGLDEEQAVNDFMAASANYDQPAALQPPPTSWVKPPAIPSDAALRRRNLIWIISASVILIAGLAAWFYLSRHANGATAIWEAVPVHSQMPQTAAPNSSTRQPATVLSAPTARNSEGNSTTAIGTPLKSTKPAEIAAAPAPNDSVAANTVPAKRKAGQTGTSDSEFLLSIHARQDTWVSIVADGRPLMDSLLLAGSDRFFRARKELMLKTGNAGGLEVSQNGKSLPPLGKEKQVKTVTFTPEGVQ